MHRSVPIYFLKLTMIEKMPDWFKELFIYREKISYTYIPALFLYTVLIMCPENNLDAPQEPVCCKDMM